MWTTARPAMMMLELVSEWAFHRHTEMLSRMKIWNTISGPETLARQLADYGVSSLATIQLQSRMKAQP
jgi:hypothetical protein